MASEPELRPIKPPYIRAVIEPIINGFYVWAEVVGGTKLDGFWVRQHYTEYGPENERCARAAAVLSARCEKEGVYGLEWDGEVSWGERRKKDGEDA
jgi:hypothetical protein